MAITKTPFAMKDSSMVDISQVESGLSCNCFCPECGDQMIAKKGEIMIHHFAHKGGAGCAGGIETALHLMAKQLILDRKQIFVPDVYSPLRTIELGRLIEFESATLEKAAGGIIADVVLEAKGRQLIVEIAVTHFCDYEKINKIIGLGLSVIEIDLSGMSKQEFDLKKLAFYLFEDARNTRWVNNAKYQKIIEKEEEQVKAAKAAAKRIEDDQTESARKKREKFIEKHTKAVTTRSLSSSIVAQHIEDCPLEVRTFAGKHYANLNIDCRKCVHFRGTTDVWGRAIVCLGEYHLAKQAKEEKPWYA
jgi:hypothetical protein